MKVKDKLKLWERNHIIDLMKEYLFVIDKIKENAHNQFF